MGPLSRCIPDFGMRPLTVFMTVENLAFFTIALLSTPIYSTMYPNNDAALALPIQ